MWSSCGPTPAGRSRSPCPARSPWPSRRRTTTTPAPRTWLSATPRRCNDEVADLFAAGADIVQLDEPYLQARPEEARKYGVKVINRALDGITGTTAVHLCFGYAAIIHDRPEGYSFLPELAACDCDQISVETAQSGLDCEVLSQLDGKTIILGVLNLGDETVESPDEVVARARRALEYVPAERIVLAPDCGMKYLPRASAFGKLSAMTGAAATLRAGAA